MRSAAVIAGIVVLLLGLASSGTAHVPTDPFLVVPGQGIGEVRLGMTITEAVKVLGNPQESRSTLSSSVLPKQELEGATIYIWSAPARAGVSNQTGFRAVADARGKIIEIMAPSPDERYHTPDGLAIGNREQAVVTRLGPPSRTTTSGNEKYDIYEVLGIAFTIETNRQYSNAGMVNGVSVFVPAHT